MIPYVAGIAVVVLGWIIVGAVSKDWNPFHLARGEDGKTSTSKLQFVLWTAVVAFSYVVMMAGRIRAGDVEVIDEIPQNVLLAMGLSVATLAGAKGITVSYLTTGRIVKPPAGEDTSGAVRDDSGDVDLVKVQMLLWTVIAIAAYLINMFDLVADKDFDQLPDIDAALMVLMGLGQGAYLGNKIVTTNTPRLTSLAPSAAAPGDTVTLAGMSIGRTQTGTQVTMDGSVIEGATSTADSDDATITFAVPATHPTKGAWPADGLTVQIGVVANGAESANVKSLTVRPSA
ncbi:MAG: hypothetical protein M3217_05210 [Actinomycetota bacterium]|nr:hypothetical protein [Actinomycetota bacterium]